MHGLIIENKAELLIGRVFHDASIPPTLELPMQ